MEMAVSQKYQAIFERFRLNKDKFQLESQKYIIQLERLKSMHAEVVARQTDLIGICQCEPNIISKYFLKYKPLSFSLVNFKDLANFGGPKMAFNNGKMYIGSIVEGKRHGKGVIACAKGKIYEGQLDNNERHGSGVQIYQRGNFYVGSFSRNKRAGKGIMVWVDQNQKNQALKFQYYNGQWKDGEPSGYGLHSSNNSIYLGQFRTGVKHGKATELVSEGELYEGGFANGHRQGRGFFFSSKDHYYEGDYKAGLKHGYGRCIYFKTNEEYQGFFQKDKKDGIGLYQKQNHFLYRGMFTDDKPNGNGQFHNLMSEPRSLSKENKAVATQSGRKLSGLKKMVQQQSQQLNKDNTYKVGQSIKNKQKSLFSSRAEKAKEQSSFSKRKYVSSAKAISTNPEQLAHEPDAKGKCKYKGCSCNNWQKRSHSKAAVDESRLKRLFSSRRIILKQVIQ